MFCAETFFAQPFSANDLILEIVSGMVDQGIFQLRRRPVIMLELQSVLVTITICRSFVSFARFSLFLVFRSSPHPRFFFVCACAEKRLVMAIPQGLSSSCGPFFEILFAVCFRANFHAKLEKTNANFDRRCSSFIIAIGRQQLAQKIVRSIICSLLRFPFGQYDAATTATTTATMTLTIMTRTNTV